VGGLNRDIGHRLALGGGDLVYLVGETASSTFPTTSGAHDPSYNGGWDVFVAGLDLSVQPTYGIAGQVQDAGGQPVEGVLLAAGPYTATTDATGSYSITGVLAGTYSIVPSRSGCTFQPVSRTITLPPDAVGQDFVAQCTFDVSGQVVDGDAQPLEGLVLTAGSYTATTDSGGDYLFPDLPAGTYTLDPPAGYFWSPLQRIVSGPPDVPEQDFVGRNLVKANDPAYNVPVSYKQVITYSLGLLYPHTQTLSLSDHVPTYTTYLSGSLVGPAGVRYVTLTNAISGTLTVTARIPLTVSFGVQVAVTGTVTTTHRIANRACVRPAGSGMGECTWSNEVWNQTYLWAIYLPVIVR
jgi:hypothetical protein